MLFGIESKFDLQKSNFFQFLSTNILNTLQLKTIVDYLNQKNQTEIFNQLPDATKHNTLLESI